MRKSPGRRLVFHFSATRRLRGLRADLVMTHEEKRTNAAAAAAAPRAASGESWKSIIIVTKKEVH